MKRKDFLKLSGILLGGMMIPAKNIFGRRLFLKGNFKELRNGVGIFSEKGGTIGWYINKDAAVIIDSQFPETAPHLLEHIKQKHYGKIDFLINTHHHNDHTAGNIYLKDFVEDIIAQEDCVKLQKQNAAADAEIVTANKTFSKEWNEDLPDGKLMLWHSNPAHTLGDSVVFFEHANIAHLGDLVFNKIYPYMDLPGGCSISGSVKYLEEIIDKYDNDTLFIFGHGASPGQLTGSKADVLHMKNYMEGLLAFVGNAIKSHKQPDEIVKSGYVPGFEDQKSTWEGAFKMNIEAAYKELTS
ncbi:MAG: MBL fold metallo-hydrolase [Ignavibacteriaceae bacterium]|nr:MBL fold metallo-hydrolase [Ignavibacteriaceae bacterium]